MDRQEFSSLVSLALDSMGYSSEAVRQRQIVFNRIMNDESSPDDSIRLILVGSIAEGISQPLLPNSDADFMIVLREMAVFEDRPDTKSCDGDELKLQMECDSVAPGYTMIKLVNMKSSVIPNICQGLSFKFCDVVERNNCWYLRHRLNEVVNDEQNTIAIRGDTLEISGPALTFGFTDPDVEFGSNDGVCAIPCFCSSHIRNWVSRTKYYGWASKEILSKIKNQIGYVVPVGVKGSKNCELEWRICYTEIENILIRSLSETQIKMYVLLKMVAKSILKPLCKDITSYVIKNLVLWIAERNAKEIFTPENLTSLLMLGLRSLRNKVYIRLFGNYMIPERNLFAGKITEDEKIKTIRVLDEILEEGPMFLVNFKELNRLKTAIDETGNNPSLVEIKTKLLHYISRRMYLDDPENDECELLSMNIRIEKILVGNYFELDELQMKKLKDLFFKSENTNVGKEDDLEEELARRLEETSDSLSDDEEDIVSKMSENCMMQ